MIFVRHNDEDHELMPDREFMALVKHSQKKGSFEHLWGVPVHQGEEFGRDDLRLVLSDAKRLAALCKRDKEENWLKPIAHLVDTVNDVRSATKFWRGREDRAITEGGPGSGNWGHKGRTGKRGGSMPGGGKKLRPTHFWKPTMTEEEAGAWGKNSVVKETMFHGTSASGAKIIRKQGFARSRISTSSGDRGSWGEGFYFAVNQQHASGYTSWKDPHVLRVRFNVQKPLTVFDANSKMTKEFKAINDAARILAKGSGTKQSIYIRQLAQKAGYDSIYLQPSRGTGMSINEFVVFDYRKVVVLE